MRYHPFKHIIQIFVLRWSKTNQMCGWRNESNMCIKKWKSITLNMHSLKHDHCHKINCGINLTSKTLCLSRTRKLWSDCIINIIWFRKMAFVVPLLIASVLIVPLHPSVSRVWKTLFVEMWCWLHHIWDLQTGNEKYKCGTQNTP